MGVWGYQPWESDMASDWYANLFQNTNLAENVRKTLNLDVKEYYEEVRAAAYLLTVLGHKYIWPINDLEKDLKLAISKLENILADKSCPLNESKEIVDAINVEIATLKLRLAGNK
jgi:Domain of unknown function (DUF4259)